LKRTLAPDFQYSQQLKSIKMENTLKFETTTMIHAPVTKVWQALTTSDIVSKYFFGNKAVSEWNVGNSIMFKGEWEGEEYLGRGIILNRVPYKLFRFSYWSSLYDLENKSENYLHVTYKMAEDGDETELITTIERIPTPEMKARLQSNFSKVLENLKQLVESEELEPVS
jgi:uncharacterized protein YndB with AHSA1/START domain